MDTKVLRAAGVHVDSSDVWSDDLCGGDSEGGCCGAELEDEAVVFEGWVCAEDGFRGAGGAGGGLDEVDCSGAGVRSAGGADDGFVDCFGAWGVLVGGGGGGGGKVPHTRSAPYFSARRRVGSSPVRTMGARTHFPGAIGVGIGVRVASRRWRVLRLRSAPRMVWGIVKAALVRVGFSGGGLSYRGESA